MFVYKQLMLAEQVLQQEFGLSEASFVIRSWAILPLRSEGRPLSGRYATQKSVWAVAMAMAVETILVDARVMIRADLQVKNLP